MIDQQRLNELEQVEEPFLRQLERLGWRVLRGDKYDPATTLCESFSEAILECELYAELRKNACFGEIAHLNRSTPHSREGKSLDRVIAHQCATWPGINVMVYSGIITTRHNDRFGGWDGKNKC